MNEIPPNTMAGNPYVARTLVRIDRLIYRLKGLETYWHDGGLTHPVRREGFFSHGYEARSHFPGWLHRLFSNLGNKHIWLRRILNY